MTRTAAAIFAALVVSACSGETPGPHTRYEYADPRIERSVKWTLYPGARELPDLMRLMHDARKLSNPDVSPRSFLLLETDAPLETVADFYAREYGTSDALSPEYGTGDFAGDEANLIPLLERLGIQVSKGVVSGRYRTALIRFGSASSVSVQRPYRDFLADKVVDRTLIMIEK